MNGASWTGDWRGETMAAGWEETPLMGWIWLNSVFSVHTVSTCQINYYEFNCNQTVGPECLDFICKSPALFTELLIIRKCRAETRDRTRIDHCEPAIIIGFNFNGGRLSQKWNTFFIEFFLAQKKFWFRALRTWNIFFLSRGLRVVTP